MSNMMRAAEEACTVCTPLCQPVRLCKATVLAMTKAQLEGAQYLLAKSCRSFVQDSLVSRWHQG